MWMITIQVNTSWDIDSCSNFINNTITLKLYTISGGRAKKLWLTSGEPLKELKVPNNLPLKELAIELAVALQHVSPLELETSSISVWEILLWRFSKMLVAASEMLKVRLDYIKDHKGMLTQFGIILNKCRWPLDNKACPQRISLPKDAPCSNSSSKQSRAKDNYIMPLKKCFS